MPQPATDPSVATRRPRYYVKRIIDDPEGGPPRVYIIGHSHGDLLAAYQTAGLLRRRHPDKTFVAGEM